MPCSGHAVLLKATAQHGRERQPCCAVALRRTAWSEHGMASVNQTRPHCVNQMRKTHSKLLAARHGRGTAWTRHAVCESALKGVDSRFLSLMTFVLAAVLLSCFIQSPFHVYWLHSNIVAQCMSIGLEFVKSNPYKDVRKGERDRNSHSFFHPAFLCLVSNLDKVYFFFFSWCQTYMLNV